MPAAINWTSALEQAICQRITDGDTIRLICATEGFPSAPSIFKHIAEDEEFAKQYARAKEAQIEAMAEEILEIADESSYDTKTIKRGDHEFEVADNEWINRSRLRVDTRKWLMSKLAPKKYGERTALVGPDGSGPVQFEVKSILDQKEGS